MVVKARICVAGLLLCLCLGSTAGAQRWQRLGPEGGMVVSLGAGTRAVVYAGTADGHVFASEDAANHWELRGRVGTRTDAVVSRLVSEPGATGRLFAAVWYQEAGAGGGVFRSDDGGRTWSLAGLQGEAVRALEIAPGDPKEFAAGTLSGVFRSNDAGKSWQRISPVGDEELRRLDSLAIDPRDGNVIYAGTYHLPWKTTDGGKSWSPVIAGLIDDSDIMSLRVDATDPQRVYLSACSGIYRSENQGGSWTKLQGIPYAARRTQAIAQDAAQPKTLYAATTEGLWVTRDAGESWKRTTPKEWVINGVVVLRGAAAAQSGRVLIGTEGQGILVSDDAGETFSAANAGFTHPVVSQLAGDPRQGNHLLILLRTGGARLLESRDAGANWAPIPLAMSGPTKERERDTENVERIYGTPSGWLVRLRDGSLWLWGDAAGSWKEWKLRLAPGSATVSKSSGNTKRPASPAPLRVVGNSLAFAAGDLFIFTDQGLLRCPPAGNCLRLRAFARATGANAIWVSENAQVLAVAADGKLGMSNDAGGTAVWSDLPVIGPAVRWIDVAAATPDGLRVFLGTAQGLYQSSDGGTHWEHREAGLPSGQLEGWLRTTNLMVATLREAGMYVSRNAGKTWARMDQDAERARFTGLVETQPGVLAIGSQSEGVLRLFLNGT
jgi:photosystem II stability/assembly factor-like uncharacterized protein